MAHPQIIIPFYNGAFYIRRLLSTIPAGLDVLIVSDQSPQAMPAFDRPGTEVVTIPERGYWAGACNYGASLKPGRDLLFLNQDIVFKSRGWLEEVERIAAGGVDITGNWVMGHKSWPKGYVDGVFMFVRRTAWDKVGGMDATHYPMWGSSCLLQAMICRNGGRAQPFDAPRYLIHHRQGNLGDAFREVLQDEVGTQRNDGNLFRRVPPYVGWVITAHGDYDQYLPQAMESVFKQTRHDWQITISLDGTARPELREMAASYVDPWKGIRYVQQPGGRHGPPDVRNAGVKASGSRFFIQMQDGDDWAEPNAMQVMLQAVESNPHTYAYGDLRWTGDRGGIRRFPEFDYEQLLQANYITSFIMYPFAMWQEVAGYPVWSERGWDDYAYAIAGGRIGWCGVHVPEVVLNYRRHGHSRNHDSQQRRSELRTLMQDHYPDVFDRRFPEMCCGGSRRAAGPGPARKASKAPRNVKAPAGVGKHGMVELRYRGSLGGGFNVRGPATGTRYRVKKGWAGWVDVRDAEKIIALSRDFEYTGRKSGKAEVPAPVPAPAVVEAKPEETYVETPVTDSATDTPVETEERPYICGNCSKTFRTMRGLDAHLRLAHPKN